MRPREEQRRLSASPERYVFRGARIAATEAVTWVDFQALTPDHNMPFGAPHFSTSPRLLVHAGRHGRDGAERACGLRPVCTSACARLLAALLCIVSPELVQPVVDRGAEVVSQLENPRLTLLRAPKALRLASVPGVRPVEEALRDAFMRDERVAFGAGLAREFPEAPGAVTAWSRPEPSRLELDVTLEQENLVVVVEHCARGWTARVGDGEPVTPLRVDGGLCPVKVPAGTHHVTLRYRPPGWPWAWLGFFLGVGRISVAARRGTASARRRWSRLRPARVGA